MTTGQRSPGVARRLSQGGGGGKAKQRKESDIGTKQKRPHPVQGLDLESSSSDIDLVPDMFYIPDPEYNREMLIQATSLLLPGAIQAVSQRLASTINDKMYPFPTISRYFIAKARDLKVIGVDLLRHRQLIQQGDPPVFLHDDHPKLLFIVQSKFKAAKATYRSYKSQAQPKTKQEPQHAVDKNADDRLY
jgi:hypothetical protein